MVIDRYLLLQFLRATALTLATLSCLVFLTQAIRILNTLAQLSAELPVFFELAVYVMPRVLQIALPLSAFLAVMHVVHRLRSDSELLAIQAAGAGAARLIRPVLMFAAILAAATGIVTSVMGPWANGKSVSRQTELSQFVEPRVLRDNQFLALGPGLTAFVGESAGGQALADLFIFDRHKDGARVYSAQRGLLDASGTEPQLILQRGTALAFNGSWELTSRFSFERYSADIFRTEASERRQRDLDEMYLPELVARLRDGNGEHGTESIRTEIHKQLSPPVYAFVLPFLALTTLLAGRFQTPNPYRRLALCCGLGVGLVLTAFGTRNFAVANPGAAWLIYAPPLLTMGACMLALRGRAAGGAFAERS